MTEDHQNTPNPPLFSEIVDRINYIVNQLLNNLISEHLYAELNELTEKLRQCEKHVAEKPPSKHQDFQDTCPNCLSHELDYGHSEANNDIREYPYTCMNCGREFKELWKETYIETTKVK